MMIATQQRERKMTDKEFLLTCLKDSQKGEYHECTGYEGRYIDMIRRLQRTGYIDIDEGRKSSGRMGPVFFCKLTGKGMSSVLGKDIRVCGNCEKKYSVSNKGDHWPGGKDREEIICPHCGHIDGHMMTSGNPRTEKEED